MNLPKTGSEYLPVAFSTLKPSGFIHYHELVSLPDLTGSKETLRDRAKNHGFKLLDVNHHNLGSYSPSMYHYCFDMTLKMIE
jgi:tRNA G37 N-methylase Trm5